MEDGIMSKMLKDQGVNSERDPDRKRILDGELNKIVMATKDLDSSAFKEIF